MKCAMQCTICPGSETSIFSELSDKQLAELQPFQTTNTYKKDQIIFYEGNPALGVYCISEGRVKLYKTNEEGKQRMLRVSGHGALLGYASLCVNAPEQYTAEAMEDAKICFLEKNGFLQFLKKHPEMTLRLITRLSQEAIKSHEQLMDQTFKSARRRLAETLLTLQSAFGVQRGVETLLDVTLSREELSQMVGATMETVVRLLSEFKSDGLIREEKHRIIISKPDSLRAFTKGSF